MISFLLCWRGWISKAILSLPFSVKGFNENACKAEVRAPVSTLAFILAIPNSGKPTHSRQPITGSFCTGLINLMLFSSMLSSPFRCLTFILAYLNEARVSDELVYLGRIGVTTAKNPEQNKEKTQHRKQRERP